MTNFMAFGAIHRRLASVILLRFQALRNLDFVYHLDAEVRDNSIGDLTAEIDIG